MEKTWESVVDYIDEAMKDYRIKNGKYDNRNFALWTLKKKMQEVDSTIEDVGDSFTDYESNIGGNY